MEESEATAYKHSSISPTLRRSPAPALVSATGPLAYLYLGVVAGGLEEEYEPLVPPYSLVSLTFMS